MDDRRRDIALFRYSLVREAADPRLTGRERGALVRELAAREHLGPSGEPVRISRETLDRWIRAWRAGGFGALIPEPRPCVPRTCGEILALAEDLKRRPLPPGRASLTNPQRGRRSRRSRPNERPEPTGGGAIADVFIVGGATVFILSGGLHQNVRP